MATATQENRERSVQARRDKPSTATEDRTRDKRATGGVLGECGRLTLRGFTGGLPKNQSVACEARHAPTGLRAGRAPLVEVWKFRGLEAWLFQRLHPSRACRALCSLFSVLCSPGRVSAPCPACASTPPVSVTLCILCATLCSSEICGSPASYSSCTFVVLRVLSRGRFGPLGLHGNNRAAFGLIAAKGGGPGFNLWGSSKPLSF